MKKRVLALLLIGSFSLINGMVTEFLENSNITTNRFLSQYVGGTCPSSNSTASETNCGNDFVNDIIGLNIIDYLSFYGSYYIYNDFPTYVDEMSKNLNNTPPPAPNNTLMMILMMVSNR